MQEIEFFFSGTPVPKPRMTRRDKRPPARKCVQRYWDFKAEFNKQLSEKTNYTTNFDVHHVDIVIYIPMAKSWSKKKKKEHDGKPHRQTPDSDNILKAVCDAVKSDDSGIWKTATEKRWTRNDPGIHVILRGEYL